MLKQLFCSTTCAVCACVSVSLLLLLLSPTTSHALLGCCCSCKCCTVSLRLLSVCRKPFTSPPTNQGGRLTQSAVLCCSLQPNSVENCEYIGYIDQSIASVTVAVQEKALQIGRLCCCCFCRFSCYLRRFVYKMLINFNKNHS